MSGRPCTPQPVRGGGGVGVNSSAGSWVDSGGGARDEPSARAAASEATSTPVHIVRIGSMRHSRQVSAQVSKDSAVHPGVEELEARETVGGRENAPQSTLGRVMPSVSR